MSLTSDESQVINVRVVGSLAVTPDSGANDAEDSLIFCLGLGTSERGLYAQQSNGTYSLLKPVANFALLQKTSAVSQDVGGSNGTEAWWTWDTETKLDSNFTHSVVTQPSRLAVGEDGWYHIRFVGNAATTGNARTTLQGIYRVNGGTTKTRGTVRSYDRGSSYGAMTPQLDAWVQLTAGDYVEVGTKVDDTDSAYTINTTGPSISDDDHEFFVERIQ